MGNDQNSYWDDIYLDPRLQFPVYDGWLDPYINIMNCKANIIDHGCGNGVNTAYLNKIGAKPIACDFSQPALDRLIRIVPSAYLMKFDMTEGLPFYPESIDIVIADLSLHYFTRETTDRIVADIRRILRPNGILVGRVNGYEDNFEPLDYLELERDYYNIDGCTKRYFTIEAVSEYFKDWRIVTNQVQKTRKYRFEKPVVLFDVRKE